jgi:hypothetical protein
MRRKNLLLTLWLIAPIAVFAGLYALIFVTQDKEKLMADAKPIGAGAGDTGDANAIGQWLAGRDPDAVSLATKAKRERLMISPYDWPGGVRLIFNPELFAPNPDAIWGLCVFDSNGMDSITSIDPGEPELVLAQQDLGRRRIYISPAGFTDPLHANRSDSMPLYDRGMNELRPILLEPQIPARDLDVQDPMPVYVALDSVYVDVSP